MAGVDVDEDAVELELAVEHGHEAAGQRAAVDDPVHALDGAHDLEVARQAHAQPHVDVAHLQRGGQAMAGDVGDRQAEDLVGHRDVVEEVAADGLHRLRAAVHVEVAVAGGAARQDRGLDLARLLENPFHALAPQLLVDAVAHDAEREQDVVAVAARGDVEGQDVLAVADLDGGEALHAQQVLQGLVDARIVGVHVHRAVLDQQLDRRVGDRHLEAARHLLGVAEDAREDVERAAAAIQAAAVDPQLVAEVDDDALDQRLDGRALVLGAIERRHQLLDLLHQRPVVDRARVDRRRQGGFLP